MQGTKIKHSRIRITSVLSKENKGIGNIFFNWHNTNQAVKITRWENEIRFWLHYCCYLEHQHAISGPLLKKGLVNTWIYCLTPTFILADNMYDEVAIVTDTLIFDHATSYYVVLVMADPSSYCVSYNITSDIIDKVRIYLPHSV